MKSCRALGDRVSFSSLEEYIRIDRLTAVHSVNRALRNVCDYFSVIGNSLATIQLRIAYFVPAFNFGGDNPSEER